LSMIDPSTRQRYDYNNIEKLYTEYVGNKIDDYSAINDLKMSVEGKNVLLLVPGNTLNIYRNEIDRYIEENQPIIISVNFVTNISSAFTFFGNLKRYSKLSKERQGKKVIISSNIKPDNDKDIVVNYYSLINRGYKYFENSTIMLLNLLKRVNPSKIAIAGFDGFDINNDKNYMDDSYQ